MIGPKIHISSLPGIFFGDIKRNMMAKANPNNISGLSKLFNPENIVRITLILAFNLLNAPSHNSEKKSSRIPGIYGRCYFPDTRNKTNDHIDCICEPKSTNH
jgi:hypothetical protein